jgi:hypothetical protein
LAILFEQYFYGSFGIESTTFSFLFTTNMAF